MAYQSVVSGFKNPNELIGANPQQYSLDYDAIRMGREGFQNAQKVANIQNLGVQNQQKRFDTVFPWLQNQITGMMGNLSSTVGGQSGQGPTINAGPIWNPQQIQQKVNNARAFADQGAATQQRVAQRGLASRGFSTSSPMMTALNNQIGNNALSQKVQAGYQIPMEMAEGNAKYQMAGQQAREQQFGNRMDEDIRRRQTILGMFPGLLGAISGLV